MIKIAICDDSDYMREEIKKHITAYSFKREFSYTLDEFETGEKLLESNEEYDLVFMDYKFEGSGLDGISTAKQLRERQADITIIFLSSYPGAVFQSFEVGAFRFLLKPVDEEKFNAALEAFLLSTEEEKVLLVRVKGMNHFIKESKISYIEGIGKNCIINFLDKSKKFECHETLSSMEQRLKSKSFYRCYKSYIVNMKHVNAYNRTDVVLKNGDSILMSRNKYKEFTEKYSDYLTRQR